MVRIAIHIVLTFAWMLGIASPVASQVGSINQPLISFADKFRIEQQFHGRLHDLLEQEAKAWQLPKEYVRGEVQVTFDPAKLRSDFSSFQKATAQRQADYEKEYSQSVLSLLERLQSKAETKQETNGAASSAVKPSGSQQGLKIRFGDLNIDIDPSEFDFIVPETVETSSPVAVPQPRGPDVSVTLSSPGALGVEPFVYQAEDYIKEIRFSIVIPQEAPEGAEKGIQSKVMGAFFLEALGSKAQTRKWVKVDRADQPIAAEGSQSQEQSIVALTPSNNFLGLLIASLLLAGVVLFGVITIGGGFKSIANSILELKPEPGQAAAASSEPAAKSMAAEDNEPAPKEEASPADFVPERKGATGSDEANALTASMEHLRAEIGSAASENPGVFAEILSDLFYEAGGMVSLRELLTFVGFKPLQDALKQLPPAKVKELRSFVQDRQDIEGDIFAGIEMAQQIIRDYITRLSTTDPVPEEFTAIKQRIMATDDAILGEIGKDFTGEEAALVLKSLTKARSNWLVKRVPAEVLQEAVKIFDDITERAAEITPLLTQRLEKAQEDAPTTSKDRLSFILRLVRSASLEDEAIYTDLVEKGDWPIRIEMMRAKFFYSDIRFIPKKTLKGVLNDLKMKKRAEFIALAEGQTREHLLGIYPQDGRLREMLDTELGLIENNPRRKKELDKRRTEVIEEFMAKLRNLIEQDRSILDDVIEAQCKEYSLTPPGEGGASESGGQAA